MDRLLRSPHNFDGLADNFIFHFFKRQRSRIVKKVNNISALYSIMSRLL